MAYEDAWVDFLAAVERVRDRLNNLKKITPDNKLSTRLGQFEQERKNDSWLNYLTQARNAQGHTIQSIVGYKPGISVVRTGSNGPEHIYSIGKDGEKILEEYAGAAPSATIQPHRLLLQPVLNGRDGKTYYPPFRDSIEETGKPLHEHAYEALKFYLRFLEQIAAEFFSIGTIVAEMELPELPLTQKCHFPEIYAREATIYLAVLPNYTLETTVVRKNHPHKVITSDILPELSSRRDFKVAISWNGETIEIVAIGKVLFSGKL